MGPPVRRRQEDDRERFMEIKYILVTKKFEIRMSMYAVHCTVSTPVDKKLEILELVQRKANDIHIQYHS